MDTQQNKTTRRRSSAMSGSLAYYNLLAGINVARRSDQTKRITAEVGQAFRNESAKR